MRFSPGDEVELPERLRKGQDGREGVVVASWATTHRDRENVEVCTVARTVGGGTRHTVVPADELYRLDKGPRRPARRMVAKAAEEGGHEMPAAKKKGGAGKARRPGPKEAATRALAEGPRRKPAAKAARRAPATKPEEYGLQALMGQLRETGECRIPEGMDPRRFRAWNAAKKVAAEKGIDYLGTTVEDGHVVARVGTKPARKAG